MGRGRRFDDAEAALVFRRAAELAHPEPGERPQLDAAALAEIGRQVGLPEEAVRRAVREQRLGLLERQPRRWWRLEGDGVAVVEDVLRRDRASAEEALADALSRRGMEQTAAWGERSRWQPDEERRRRLVGAWAARTCLHALGRVDVRVRDADGTVRVRLEGRLRWPRWIAAVVAWAAVLFFSPLVVAGLVASEDSIVFRVFLTLLVFVLPMVGIVRLARGSLATARRHVREALATVLNDARTRTPRSHSHP